jgi:branched-chain amino acid transport system substrate-binding protein
MKNKIIWIVVVLIVIIGLISLNGGSQQENETGPIKIGFSGPLTGDAALYGENAKAAVEIAVEEINSTGGIDGREVEVVYEDDKCAGKDSVNASKKLIEVDNVTASISGLCSAAMTAAAPIYEEAKTVQIGYCATSPELTNAGDYNFRVVPSDALQSEIAADYIYNEMGNTKAAVIYRNDDWGNGLANSFKETFESLGGEIVIFESSSPESLDYRQSLTKVKDSEAEILYFLTLGSETLSGIRQYKELNIEIPAWGADAWDTPEVWQELNGLGDGLMFLSASTNPTEEFKQKMKEKVGSDDLIYCSNYAYDATKILANVISEVGTDSEKIKDALYDVEYSGGVSQQLIKFDENGDINKDGVSYSLKQVQGTEIIEVNKF